MHRSRLLIACVFALAAGLVASAAWREPARSTSPPDPAAVAAPDRAPATSLDPAAGAPPAEPARVGEAERSGKTPATAAAAAPQTAPNAASREETAPVTEAVAVTPAAAPGATGRIVAIDPETGELVPPSAEQIRELFPPGTQVEAGDENVIMVYRPDGTVLMQVGPRIQDYSFAHIGEDGKPIYGCGPLTLTPGAAPVLPAPAPKTEDR